MAEHAGRRPLTDVVAAYLASYQSDDEAYSWAVDEVTAQVTFGNDPGRAWELVLALVEAADESNLGHVGAGPLEDCVRRFAPQLIGEIEARGRRDPKFRACLGTIWLGTQDLPPDILARVMEASDGRIVPD